MTEFNFFATLTAINKQHAANLNAAANPAGDRFDSPARCLPEPESSGTAVLIVLPDTDKYLGGDRLVADQPELSL